MIAPEARGNRPIAEVLYGASQLPQDTYTAMPAPLQVFGDKIFQVQTSIDVRQCGESGTGTWHPEILNPC